MLFKDVIGHEAIKEHLTELVQQNRLSHALLFLGKEGCGALPLALAFAQYVVSQPQPAPLVEDLFGGFTALEAGPAFVLPDNIVSMPAYERAAQLMHPDLHFTYPVIPKKSGEKPISTDYANEWREFIKNYPYGNVYDWLQLLGAENKQGNITADECNDIMRKLNLKSFESEYKVLLLWMPEYLGKEGNKLLKLIEEPPPNTLFILVAENEEQIIPTILTTSQKLSTGVDARNIRNIVLMRPVNSMIEFKQIVGRGTRLFDGKEFFTIYDFVNAYHHFADPEWDGEPIELENCAKCGQDPCVCVKTPSQPCPICSQIPCICPKEPPPPCYKCHQSPCVCIKKVKVKLKDGKEREIRHMISTSFWGANGKPISAEEFLNNLFGTLPSFFKSEEELRFIWSNPMTRRTLLEKLDEAGYGKEQLSTLQQLINAEKSDLYDVLEYVFNSDIKPMTREARVAAAQATIFALLNNKQKEFIEFVLTNYIETGVEELDQDKLPILLVNKYQSLEDAKEELGEVAKISSLFIEFQKYLYEESVA